MPPNNHSTGTDTSPPSLLPPPSDHPDEQLASIPALPATLHGVTIHTTRNTTRHEILVLGMQLGKSSITAWAMREEEENDASKCLKVVIQQQQQQQNQAVDFLRPDVDQDEVRRTMVESHVTAWEEAEHAKYMAKWLAGYDRCCCTATHFLIRDRSEWSAPVQSQSTVHSPQSVSQSTLRTSSIIQCVGTVNSKDSS
ncbi:hypothetical protein SELMODRAFT_414555 [Selaginella moellendorffii]|uniref:Uncharacterized protein n=1 Tax=Selaginella moellendorffii TaxID=88036 RepID=D8RT57_SELML|nr:hypothetical protein SELMODRAFT_414555 [Selaginella moellendorffii]